MHDLDDLRKLFESAALRPLTDEEWETLNAVIVSHIVLTRRDPTGVLLNLISRDTSVQLRELMQKAEKKPMIYGFDTCHRCGATVRTNWIIRHLKSGCKVGVGE